MFQRFFYGRNGPDHIALTALILAAIINFAPYGFIVSLLLVAYAFFRMLSKNVAKRRSENYKYVAFWQRLRGGFKNFSENMKDSKTHKVFACPKCSQKLRVPKGKGKLNITCSKCKYKFMKKT